MTPTLKILYGPPGTGKTWRAAREAVELIEPGTPAASVVGRHKALVESGRIIWVTFHPSYSYEDFVEGFRPVSQNGAVVYLPKPGPFKTACSRCGTAAPLASLFQPGQVLQSSTHQEYEVVHVDRGAVVLKNRKGKGADLLTPVTFWLLERLIANGYRPGDLSIPGTEHDKKDAIVKKTEVDVSTLFTMTGPLRTVWEEVERRGWTAAATRQPIVLVIDEINRADLSRVFGELITLLEADKRIGAPEERRILLPYSQTLFGVPDSLHIVGTMNTADRSLTLMDHALRRRFEFQEIGPEPERCAHPYAGVDLRDVLRKWNRRISALLTREQVLGHAYLMESRLEDIRVRRGFAKDAEGELKSVAVAIRETVLPLLLEYFHDDWRKVDLVFGRDYRRRDGGLLEALTFEDVDAAADDIADLSDSSDFKPLGCWTPSSTDWNPDEFRQRLVR